MPSAYRETNNYLIDWGKDNSRAFFLKGKKMFLIVIQRSNPIVP